METIIRISAVFAITLLFLVSATVAYATDPPDSDPSIVSFYANINLREEGDVLIYGEYNIPYAELPDESADQTYMFRLIDTDNVTQLGAILPYARFDTGYNRGAFGFYFSAADNLTADMAYTIRISQSPAFFESPSSYDYMMPLSAWTSKVDREQNQAELTLNIISIARELEIAHDVELLESSAGGTILSSPTGENYFRGVIYGIQSMTPDLFLVQVYSFDTGDRAWTTAQFDDYQARWGEEWMGVTTANTSATFGMTTPTLMSVVFGLPIIIGAVVISAIKFKRIDPAYLVAALILILLAVMGWMSTALFATIYQLMAIYIGYLWFYARST